jgi:hypothetical protein|tara:strand:+ start:900 stop:1076 length:177 start_codon:yes stop_codon:yes gene_type:complete
MPFDKLEEMIEKYSAKCIDKGNKVIIDEECNKMLQYLQRKILHKSRNHNILINDANKK